MKVLAVLAALLVPAPAVPAGADGVLVAVHDPLSRWLGPVPADKAGVTVQQLLTHTSGLVDWSGHELATEYDARGRAHGTPLEHPWAAGGPWWHLRGNGGLLSTGGDGRSYAELARVLGRGTMVFRATNRGGAAGRWDLSRLPLTGDTLEELLCCR